jgi:amidase
MESSFVKTFEIAPYRPGLLSGLTFAVKDCIDVAGYKTSFGNPTWEKMHSVEVAHAVCVEQLLSHGAVCRGKTISDEFTFSLLGENYFYGTPLNPKAPGRIPGGSSSGSASAVAAGLVDFALGTDAGGSIRVPASNCGIFGLRPSHGRISVAGVKPFAPSFDTVGLLAKSAEILHKVATVLLGTDLDTPKKLKKIYLLEDAFQISDGEVREALEPHLKNLHDRFECSSITLREIFHEETTFEMLFKLFSGLQWAEVWTSLGTWLETFKPELGPATASNLNLAKNYDRKKIAANIHERIKIKKRLNAFLEEDQLLCLPTTPALAPKKGSIPLDRTKGTYYPRLLGFTALAGLGALAQLTVPHATADSIPIGLSFLSAHGKDALLLNNFAER